MRPSEQQIAQSKKTLKEWREDLDEMVFDAYRKAVQLEMDVKALSADATPEENIARLDRADAQLTTLRTLNAQMRRKVRQIQKRADQHQNGVFQI